MKEVWKDIKGYEGLYQISNIGRVKSLSIEKPTPKGQTYRTKERIRKLDNRRGYPCTKLHHKCKYEHRNIHRLVAEAFIDNPKDLKYVNHIDSNKMNPHVDNLEWCTASHNIKHSIESGTFPIGSRRYNNKVTEDDVVDIHTLRKSGSTYRSISERYGVSLQAIFNICKGKTWKHIYNRMVVVPCPPGYHPEKHNQGNRANLSNSQF